MKLDRDINKDGKGKYALVRLRNINKGDEAFQLLQRLHELGHLDWGKVGDPDEFFVIKLRDKFSQPAIVAYADAVMRERGKGAYEEHRSSGLIEYALAVQKLSSRSGILSEFCKEPD